MKKVWPKGLLNIACITSFVIRHTLLEINFHKLILNLQNLFYTSTDFLKFTASKAGFHRRMTYDL